MCFDCGLEKKKKKTDGKGRFTLNRRRYKTEKVKKNHAKKVLFIKLQVNCTIEESVDCKM